MDTEDPIVRHPSPILRRLSRPVGRPDRAVLDLGRAMAGIMEEAGGVGLAAIQVGVPLRMFVARHPDLPPLVIDPLVEWASPETGTGTEGCLSIPGRRLHVPRSVSIRIAYTAQDGIRHRRELHGYPARIAQHEIDHLDGILIVDRLVGEPAPAGVPDRLGHAPAMPT